MGDFVIDVPLWGQSRVSLGTLPVILGPQTWPAWLGEASANPPPLTALLAPYPADEMTCWPVSLRVGNVKNNDPSLIEAIAAE